MTRPGGPPDAAFEQRCIDTIRFLAVDAVQKAKSGHPGMPMGAAPMGYVLFTRHLRFDAHDPEWPDRDRFVLSAGHGSMLQYALLYLTGYGLTIDDLKQFRQYESRTPGHPEYGDTPGVETTTGPLGQGFGAAVGMAVAERFLGATFNDAAHAVQDHYTYVIAGDGDMMEGVSSEAASFAGHQGLGKLIVLYDDNHISIDGSTELAFTEDVVRALRGLRLARAARGGRQRPRGHRRRPHGGQGRDGQAVAHRGAHPHRLRLAAQAGHGQGPRRGARRGRGRAHQGEPRLAARARVLRARRRQGVLRGGGGARGAGSRRLGARPSAPGAPPTRRAPRCGTTPGRGACRTAGTPTCRCSRPTAATSPRGPPPARRSTRSPPSCRRSSAARPT